MSEIISVRGLKKQFGEIKAVDDLHFSVEKGELFGFLGVNGAGKSTTINMLCTLLSPTAGQAKLCGYELGKNDGDIRRRIGVVWQHNCLDDRLSVKENLYVRGSLYGFGGQELRARVNQICETLHLEDIFSSPYKRLSGGQKRRCEIAAALINTPEILFLDEPTTGLDPQTRQFVWESMRVLQKENGTTIFLTTHYMEEAANARHIAIIDHGRILEYGTPFTLKEQYAKDRLHLIPRDGCEAEVVRILTEMRANASGQADAEMCANTGGRTDAEMCANTGGQTETEICANAGGQTDMEMRANAGEADTEICANAGEADTEMHGSADRIPKSMDPDITRADGRLILPVKESMDALMLLNAVRHCLSGFEMIQGTLDDVFLNVTGKSLEKHG